ncbi:MAG: YbaK/EbsC family protein [Candidatus Pacebacteria bacterium]|nr:YbaK/EbsC family protein [Candidatus Paceibacterota bacterium]
MEIKNQLENSLNNSSSNKIFDKIVDFLNIENVNYRVIEHEVVRSSQEESEKTGTNLSQGAKTLIMFGDGHPLMVVLSSIDKIEFKKLKKALHIKDLVMATPDQIKEVVGVEVGAVPPFGNLLNLPLYVDNHLAEKEIILGTGLFTKSIMMRYCDFEKVAKPMVGDYIIK